MPSGLQEKWRADTILKLINAEAMKINYILAILATVGGLSAAFTNHSEKNNFYPTWKTDNARVEGQKVDHISVMEVADLLFHKTEAVNILDVRDKENYEAYHLPTAIHFENGDSNSARDLSGKIILYGSGDDEKKLSKIDDDLPGKVYIMKGGLEEWYSLILFPDFLVYKVRNQDRLIQIINRSRYFGGSPKNSQLLNINVRKSRYREGC